MADIWSFVGTACCRLQSEEKYRKTGQTLEKSLRHIILLAFCQPSCHIRFSERSSMLRPQQVDNNYSEGNAAEKGLENEEGIRSGRGVLRCTGLPLHTFTPIPHALYASLDLHSGQRQPEMKTPPPCISLLTAPFQNPTTIPFRRREKSLIVAQFSSYCICRFARFSHLPCALLKIAKESMYSFICPTLCTVG